MNSERVDDVRRLRTLLFLMGVLLLAACSSDEEPKVENQTSKKEEKTESTTDDKRETEEETKEDEKEDESEETVEDWMVAANFDITSETDDITYFKGHDLHKVGDTAVIYNTDLKQEYEMTVNAFFLTDEIGNLEKRQKENYFLVADVTYKNIGEEPMPHRFYLMSSLYAVAKGTENPLTFCHCNLKDSELNVMETIRGVSFNIQNFQEEDLEAGAVTEGQMVYEIEPTDEVYMHVVSGNNLETETFVFDLNDAEAVEGNVKIEKADAPTIDLGEKVVMQDEEGNDALEVTLQNPVFAEVWPYSGVDDVDYGRKELRIETVVKNISSEAMDMTALFKYIGQSRLINETGVQRMRVGAHSTTIKDEDGSTINELEVGDTITIPLVFEELAPFEGDFEVFYQDHIKAEVIGGQRWGISHEDIDYGGFDKE